jgi:hypothetical protein
MRISVGTWTNQHAVIDLAYCSVSIYIINFIYASTIDIFIYGRYCWKDSLMYRILLTEWVVKPRAMRREYVLQKVVHAST